MATVINTVNTQRFSLNGVQYFKNFTSFVVGNEIQVFSAYDRTFCLIPFTDFTEIKLDGTIYTDVESLQAALLPVIYTRATLGTSTDVAGLPIITVFGNPFFLKKHPSNNNPALVNTLQLNDIIVSGYRSTTEFWHAARYKTAADQNNTDNWQILFRNTVQIST